MKIYYLRFTESDFTKVGQVWKTPVIDLYNNAQYKNYSTTKASFGLDSLGNGVYTGLELISPTQTDIGLLSSGRFIDTSGRVDIVAWNVSYDIGILGEVPLSLSVYSAEADPITGSTPDPTYLDYWAVKNNITESSVIFANDVTRYAFFEIHWNRDVPVNTTIELLIRIEIDPPVIRVFFPETTKLQNQFPEWMSLREYDPLDPASQQKTTPTTIGGSYLNAISGEWLNDLRGKIDYVQFQAVISTVDLSQKAWVYETSDVPNFIYSITGDGVQLSRVASIAEFYDTDDDEDAFFWNEANRTIFCNKLYTSLIINGDANQDATPDIYAQSLYHTWNTIDDIGVSVDLFRLFGENNDSFKKRILDVYQNRPGVSVEAFKLALRRELNLWRYASPSATPSSDFSGATPEILEMRDLEDATPFFEYNGMPTPRFMALIEDLAIRYPMTWGYFKYNNAFWDADGFENAGTAIIPRLFDATPVSEESLESGVGDGNDIYLMPPDAYTGARPFSAKMKIRGRQKSVRTEYPALTFVANIYGQANDYYIDNPDILPKFTLEITIDGVVYYHNFTVTIHSDSSFSYATPTFRSHGSFTWMTESLTTDLNVDLHTKSTFNTLYGGATPAQAPTSAITKVEIKPGWWSTGDQAYQDVPSQAAYRLWWSDDPLNGLGFGGSDTAITIPSYNTTGRRPTIMLESRESSLTGYLSNSYSSDRVQHTITINGGYPGMVAQSSNILLPTIPWPVSTDASSRQYIIEIVTTDGLSTGAYTDGLSSTPIFVSDSYILANGSAGWINGIKSFPSATTTITFSSGSGADYPVQATIWSMFEAEQTLPITGTVDQNGPWRNNEPQAIGNTNYLLEYLSLDRSDFGLAHSADYMITWLGVSSVSDDQVIVWIDTNTVKPAVVDISETVEITYPDNVITETLTGGIYSFSSFAVKARLKPGVTEEWFPRAYSGWFHDDVDEYYMYSRRAQQSATASYRILDGLNRLGAPIIVQGKAADLNATPLFQMRQVAFDASPSTWDLTGNPQLSLTNTEQVEGTGVNILYASYNDIYAITVKDLHTGSTVPLSSAWISANMIQTVSPTNKDHTYELSYKLKYSFYADNDYQDPVSGDYKTKLTFDATPSNVGLDEYLINYESSVYDPATPIDVPLNTFYTSTDEGFIFIDHDVHDLSKIEIRIDPTKVIADGLDYSLVTVKAYDEFGNPKPNETFNMYTNFGVLSDATVTTDRDGFASLILQSQSWSDSLTPFPSTPPLPPATPNLGDSIGGVILASGEKQAQSTFSIHTHATPDRRLTAMPMVDAIPADGVSEIYIIGKVETAAHQGVSTAVVFWKKNRYLYKLFAAPYSHSSATPGRTGVAGKVIADTNGRFRIGPFVAATPSEPGHWLVSAESSYATPISGSTPTYSQVGDIVHWSEYTDTSFGVENIGGMPNAPMQYATPSWNLPTYTLGSAFPVTYDETDFEFGHQPGLIEWTPPHWYAIDRYAQYQMGLLGDDYWTYNQGATPNFYPDYKEF